MINTEWYSIRTLTLPATAVALLITFYCMADPALTIF